MLMIAKNLLVLGEGQRMLLMKALDHQRKSLILVLVKQIQNFASTYIIMLTKVSFLLMGKKY